MACDRTRQEYIDALNGYVQMNDLLKARLLPMIAQSDGIEWFNETTRLMDEAETARHHYEQKWWEYQRERRLHG